MLRITALTTAFLVLLAVIGYACGVRIVSAGPNVVRERSVGSFERVQLDGSTDVEISRGPRSGKLTVSGGKNRVEEVRTRVEGDTLHVSTEGSSGRIELGGGATVTVTSPSLSAIDVEGSGDVSFAGVEQPMLALRIGGSGDISGSGRVGSLDGRVEGSGDLDLAAVVARSATIEIEGSGDARIEARRALDATVRGSGDVHYSGDPRVTRDVDGSGDVSAD